MLSNDFQEACNRTLNSSPGFTLTDEQLMTVWTAIGIAGEAGEVSELVKHGIFHQQGINKQELIKELGDILWYISALCTTQGITLDEVMEQNVAKLKARYPHGYNPKDGVKRMDEQPS